MLPIMSATTPLYEVWREVTIDGHFTGLGDLRGTIQEPAEFKDYGNGGTGGYYYLVRTPNDGKFFVPEKFITK